MNSIQNDEITTNTMQSVPVTSDAKAVIGIYNTHPEAEAAVNELQRASFDVKKLSVVGKDYHTDEQVVGYYNAGDLTLEGELIPSIVQVSNLSSRAIITCAAFGARGADR